MRRFSLSEMSLLPPAPLNVTIPPMTHRHRLLLLTLLTLLAFGLRVLSLDAQSMWRDEIDTLCFALDFWDLAERAVGHGREIGPNLAAASSSPADRPHCQSTPGLSRIDPAEGLWQLHNHTPALLM
jgi:hypothetical protein